MTDSPARWGEISSAFTPQDQVDVLIVDDDDGLRSTWAEIFRSSGYSVAMAEDGDVALRLLREMTIGLVLLDLRMPRRDGFSVLESLTAPQLVVLASAQALDETTLARVEGKIVTYLEKPIPPRATVAHRGRRPRSFSAPTLIPDAVKERYPSRLGIEPSRSLSDDRGTNQCSGCRAERTTALGR